MLLVGIFVSCHALDDATQLRQTLQAVGQ